MKSYLRYYFNLIVRIDLELFDKLKQYCTSAGREINELLTQDLNLDQQLEGILSQVKRKISWKGTKKLLLIRIKKVAMRTQFSVRERKLLRLMIIKQLETNSIDFTKFGYYFPAISDEKIKQEAEIMITELIEKQFK